MLVEMTIAYQMSVTSQVLLFHKSCLTNGSLSSFYFSTKCISDWDTYCFCFHIINYCVCLMITTFNCKRYSLSTFITCNIIAVADTRKQVIFYFPFRSSDQRPFGLSVIVNAGKICMF